MGYSRKGLLFALLGAADSVGGNLLDATVARRRAEDMGQYSLFGGSDSEIEAVAVSRSPTCNGTSARGCSSRRRCSGCTCPTIRCSGSRVR